MTTLFRSPSTSRCPRTLLPQGRPQGSPSQNLLKRTCSHIHHNTSPRKTSSSCAARRKPCFECVLQQDAPRRCLVRTPGTLAPPTLLTLFPAPTCSCSHLFLFVGHTSPILCAAFSPTGNLLATGSGDCNARLWDLSTETPSHVLSGHKGWVLCVEWEAMERKLATGGHDGHVRAGCSAAAYPNKLITSTRRSGCGIPKPASRWAML